MNEERCTVGSVTVLAYDQSTRSTGYAVYRDEVLLISGVWALPKGRRQQLRSLKLLTEMLQEQYQPHVIVVEDAIGGGDGRYTVQALSQLIGVIILFTQGQVYCIPTSSWRKAVLGTGVATKQQAIAYVKEQYCLEVKHDQAEAICIGASWYMAGKEKFRMLT